MLTEKEHNVGRTKEPLTLVPSDFTNELLQTYMKIVYNTDEADFDAEKRVENAIEEAKLKFPLFLTTEMQEVHFRSMKLLEDMFTIDIDKNFYLSNDTLYLVKSANSRVVEHIEEDITGHRYIQELNYGYDLLEMGNNSLGTPDYLSLIVVYNDKPGYWQKKVKVMDVEFGHSLKDEINCYAQTLKEAILSGVEPSLCVDTWGGKRCALYCQYAKHRLGLCSQGGNDESNS
jgi:hypothetical protein